MAYPAARRVRGHRAARHKPPFHSPAAPPRKPVRVGSG